MSIYHPTIHGFLTVLLLITASTATASVDRQSLESIAAAASQHVQQNVRVPGATITPTVKSIDTRLRLARCATPLETFTPQNTTPKRNFVVGVKCSTPKPWKIYVPVSVAIERKVVVSMRPLARGHVLRPEDLDAQTHDVADIQATYFTDKSHIVGKSLKRSVPSGAFLHAALLDNPAIVKRGQKVTLMAERDGVRVKMSGTALEDGAINDQVRVENLSSKRRVEGTVLAHNLVKVTTY